MEDERRNSSLEKAGSLRVSWSMLKIEPKGECVWVSLKGNPLKRAFIQEAKHRFQVGGHRF